MVKEDVLEGSDKCSSLAIATFLFSTMERSNIFNSCLIALLLLLLFHTVSYLA